MRIFHLPALLVCAMLVLLPFPAYVAHAASTPASTLPAGALIQPADLAAMLHPGGTPPVILQVGFSVLYTEAHIPGALYAGPTSKPDGIENLKSHVECLPRGRLLVIYCGCCPWTKCPNDAPAYEQLHAMGFTNVKALYLANNFGDDWVSKGYPVVRGN